jgi:hypothetical protein
MFQAIIDDRNAPKVEKAIDGIFETDRFMSDLGKLYNAVRFYVALEGILFAEDDVAYNLYEEGRYFESYSYFEKYKHAVPEVPDDIVGEPNTPQTHISTKLHRGYSVSQDKRLFSYNSL